MPQTKGNTKKRRVRDENQQNMISPTYHAIFVFLYFCLFFLHRVLFFFVSTPSRETFFPGPLFSCLRPSLWCPRTGCGPFYWQKANKIAKRGVGQYLYSTSCPRKRLTAPLIAPRPLLAICQWKQPPRTRGPQAVSLDHHLLNRDHCSSIGRLVVDMSPATWHKGQRHRPHHVKHDAPMGEMVGMWLPKGRQNICASKDPRTLYYQVRIGS